jgi:probable HAF family extracellular repeat protein
MLRRMIVWSATALAAVLLSGEESVQAGNPSPPTDTVYTHDFEWLGTDDSVFESWGYGLNNVGDVVGLAYWHTGPTESDWIGEAFIARAVTTETGETREIVNLNSEIPVPAGARLYAAYDINDVGQIVGDMSYRDGYTYAFRYTPWTAELEVLGTHGIAPAISIDQYTRINRNGDILVYSSAYQAPCIYTYDTRELMPIQRTDGIRIAFRDMNNSRRVAGFFPGGLFGPYTPVRYTPPDVFKTFGWLKSPGSPPSGKAQGINELGQVTGYMTAQGGRTVHAFRYTDGELPQDLGGLGDLSTKGNSINLAGHVVGDAGGSGGTAFVHLGASGMFDLRKSTKNLPSEVAQSMMTARRINDTGWVLGKIGPYAYLLRPL